MGAVGPEPANSAVRDLDAFISYSHRDDGFVVPLARALEERGRNVWVDGDDIPPGAPWRRELGTAIEAANAFVFVISPDAVASPECERELERAVSLGKRLVPVRYRDTPDVPEALRAMQWISVLDPEELDAPVSNVIRAIDTDHDWVRGHTRWLARALEWETDEDRSKLLRGRELAAAEAWLAESAGKSPAPTSLQTRFVAVSRADERRRLRQIAAATSVALLVALGLAVFALIQRGTAIDQRDRAQSRELAASADSQLDVDPELSLLLADRAERVKDSPQAVDALRRALMESHVRRVLDARAGTLLRAAFSPDGRLVATGGDDGAARLWSAAKGSVVRVLRGHRGTVRQLRFTPDGRFLVTAGYEDDAVRVWPVRGRRPPLVLPAGGRVRAVDVSPRGDRLLAAVANATVRVWDLPRGDTVGTLPARERSVADATFSADGRRVVTAGGDGTARVRNVSGDGDEAIWRAPRPLFLVRVSPDDRLVLAAQVDGSAVLTDRSGRRVARLPEVFTAAFSPDSSLVATASVDGRVRVWSTRSGRRVAVLAGHAGPVLWVAFSPDSSLVVTGGVDATARIWEARGGSSVAVLRGHRDAVNSVQFAADGQRVVTASSDGTARVWQAVDETVLRGHGSYRVPVNERRADVYRAQFSADGRRVLTVANDATARLWDARTGRESQTRSECGLPPSATFSCLATAAGLTHGVSLTEAALSPDGRRVALADERGGADIRDAENGKRVAALVGHRGPVWSIDFDRRGDRVLTAGADGTARLWPANGGRPGPVMRGHRGAVNDAAFTGDGRQVLTAGEDGTVRRWDGRDGREIDQRRLPGGSILAVAGAPEGGLVAATAGETARVWSPGHRAGVVLRGHDGLVTDVAFDPSGTLVVTAGLDGTARVWEAKSGRSVAVLRGNERGVNSAAFSPDGRRVVTAGKDGTARILGCDACVPADDLAGLAERRATRGLTRSERARYLHQ